MMNNIAFTNLWGNSYTLPIYAPRAPWNDVPGIYVFLKPSSMRPGYWEFLYVGQAKSLKERLQCHERWPSAQLRGCTAIAALPVWNAIERDALERDLIQTLRPVMNSQHNSLRSFLG